MSGIAHCCYCNEKMLGTIALNEDDEMIAPQSGDITICTNCGGWLVFVHSEKLRSFEPEDLTQVDDSVLTQMRRVTADIKQGAHMRAGDANGRMRLGDVVQNCDVEPKYQCRGCERWVPLKEAKNVGGCPNGCCDDYECPHCKHVMRVEWPD